MKKSHSDAIRAKERGANLDRIFPTAIAAIVVGALFLAQVTFDPESEARGLAYHGYLILFSSLFAFGALSLVLNLVARVRPLLPFASVVVISLVTAGLAATDSLVSGDMSALALGLVCATVVLRTRISLHLLRCGLTTIIYVYGVRLLSGHLPSLGNLSSAVVSVLLSMLVAFVLERYAQGSFLLQVEVEERNRELQEISFRDSLTGLYNRRFLDEELARSFALSRRSGEPFCLILLDIDYFKSVNDEFGHDEGDRVLVSIAAALAGCLRESDTVGRFGGEEFLVILPESRLEGGRHVAARIMDAVRSIEAGKIARPVTASAGLVESRASEELAELFHRADSMLYSAKRNGRNRIEA